MKVLMLSDLYTPVIGGGERHVQLLSREFVKRGHEVVVCTIGHPSLSRYEEENDVKVCRLEGIFQKLTFLFKDPTRRWHPPTSDWLVSKKLDQIVFKEKPDIVHAHGRILYSMLTLRSKHDIPLIVTLHGYWPVCPTSNLMNGSVICDSPLTKHCISCGRESYSAVKSLAVYLATKLNSSKLKLVDKFVAVSSFVGKVHLRHLGLRDRDIVVLPNFYAPEVSRETSVANNLPEDFILFVGALIPHKGVNVLIEAYQRLHPRTKLVVIGARHPSYALRKHENVLVIENAPRELVLEAYRRCRFAVFPSIWPDPCPTVAFEAMSHKKAIISSRIGGFTDIVVDGETGILVPANDVEALSSVMKHLLGHSEIAESMGQKGHELWKQRFTPEVVIPQIEGLYQSEL